VPSSNAAFAVNCAPWPGDIDAVGAPVIVMLTAAGPPIELSSGPHPARNAAPASNPKPATHPPILHIPSARISPPVRPRGAAEADMSPAPSRFILPHGTRRALSTVNRSPFCVRSRVSVHQPYGVERPAVLRRAADFVDKVLKGAKPAEVRVEQATKHERVVNLNTAKALGVTIPNSLRARADEVIQ